MKKGVFVVRVDDYLPGLCALTLPTIERYAKKIGASFTLIDQRRYPEYPPTYEKMQVYDLGRGNDYNILFDCDLAFTEDMYDVTELVPQGSLGCWMVYPPSVTIKYDEYIKIEDPSETIPATNFLVVPGDIHKVWEPFDMSYEEASSRMKRLFVIDEYCVGRNVKKYGVPIVSATYPGSDDNLFKHCNFSTDHKGPSQVLSEIELFLS